MAEMISATFTSLNAGKGHHLPPLSSESISSMVGWISIWVWLIPSLSQLQENYTLKSGEGLSIVFVMIWLAGDALNMIGAYIEGLLPTMIILAGYYCLCDIALIWQYYYYKKYHDYFHPNLSAIRARASSNSNINTESTPLLNGTTTTNGTVTTTVIREKPRQPTLAEEAAKCVAGLAFTTLAGVISWYVTVVIGWPHPSSNLNIILQDKGWRWDGQIAGWASALLYLSSRIPQIFKNRETKCEGLSLALFVFAVAGNVTYVASILIKDLSKDYVIENLSWLIGSLGTVFLDFVVLGQFIVYREERERLVREREDNESAVIVA